jgi:hypothetical protein
MKLKLKLLPLFIGFSMFSQNFEGTVTYKIEMLNPYPEQIRDSIWQEKLKEKFGEKGFEIQKYFFKDNKYISEKETDNGKKYEVYDPKDGLIYNWTAKSDSVITKNSKICQDDVFEIIDNEDFKTILNIKCKSIIVKTRTQKIKIWYNSNYLKINPELYKGFIYNNLIFIYQKIKCLPLRIEKYGEMGQLVQTAIEFNEIAVNESKFMIPDFENIVESKFN